MRNDRAAICQKNSILLLFALILVLVAESASQSSRASSAVGRRIDEFNRQGEKATHDEMNRELRKKAPSKDELQKAVRIRSETKADLETLQDNYNLMILRLADRSEIPREFINETSDAVIKAARRLRTNLALPASKPQEKESEEEKVPSEARLQMRMLCSAIYALLTDPMVENLNVVDTEFAAKTNMKLEKIIYLSQLLAAGR